MSAATIGLFIIAILLTVYLLAWIINGVRIYSYNNKINQAHAEKWNCLHKHSKRG